MFEPLDDDPPPEREEPFATTPLDDFETTVADRPRAGFCDAVDPRQVEAALGTEPSRCRATKRRGGTLADGVDDVAHEFGCLWQAPDQSAARAWVFAPPVEPSGEAPGA